MDWIDADVIEPRLGERVVVELADGTHLFARRVCVPTNIQQAHWIDDRSIPLKLQVVAWLRVVSRGETA